MLLKQRFTIGEMAKMHRIAESTLRYYDEKGIFKPKIVDANTQYRYYTIDQFSMLETIKFLRHLDIPLKEIKRFVDERTPATALDLLEKQSQIMVKKQKEIEYMLAKMDNKIHLIKKALEKPSISLFFNKLPKRHIISMSIAPNATDEMFEFYIHSLQKQLQIATVALFSGDIGVTIAKKSLLQNEFQLYSSIFILLEHLPDSIEHLDTIAEGTYACMYHQGSYEEARHTYEIMLREIEKQGYEITGSAIELGMIDLAVTSNEADFLTEIQIPVAKK
ncbi:MerR family transcriptional regulator [Bacillaceae bacterium SAOS 7]|nr:MerR family transcriptional regulator [Bacillaceae bacterium SAOS 7]